MNRKLFQQFLHTSFNMTDDVLLDQIFKYFNSEHDADITREEWVVGFYVFLKGTEEEQTQYCFKIYDINDDGFITKQRGDAHFDERLHGQAGGNRGGRGWG